MIPCAMFCLMDSQQQWNMQSPQGLQWIVHHTLYWKKTQQCFSSSNLFWPIAIRDRSSFCSGVGTMWLTGQGCILVCYCSSVKSGGAVKLSRGNRKQSVHSLWPWTPCTVHRIDWALHVPEYRAWPAPWGAQLDTSGNCILCCISSINLRGHTGREINNDA